MKSARVPIEKQRDIGTTEARGTAPRLEGPAAWIVCSSPPDRRVSLGSDRSSLRPPEKSPWGNAQADPDVGPSREDRAGRPWPRSGVTPPPLGEGGASFHGSLGQQRGTRRDRGCCPHISEGPRRAAGAGGEHGSRPGPPYKSFPAGCEVMSSLSLGKPSKADSPPMRKTVQRLAGGCGESSAAGDWGCRGVRKGSLRAVCTGTRGC